MINMDAIRAAPLEKQPWPHLSIDNVLQQGVYDLVLGLWPYDIRPSEFKGRNWEFIYPSDDEWFSSLESSEFWCLFGQSLAENTELKSVVFDKLGIDESRSSHCEVRLITDVRGYACKPHCDTATKVVSMLLYCPKTKADAGWGTRLGEVTESNLKLAKVEPFIPNHAFIFAQNPRYIHWVDEITGDRKQILICWMCEE